MPTAMQDPTPSWLKPENASVLDSQLVKVLRAIVNANPWPKPLQGVLPNPNPAAMVADPQSQVLAVMGADMPTGKAAAAASLTRKPVALHTLEQQFPLAGKTTSGFEVRSHIPNQDSIAASLGSDYHILPGVREVSMSDFFDPGHRPKPYSVSEATRLENLTGQLAQSKSVNPLIVVVDAEQHPYVLEGGHRIDALQLLGTKSFPAQVVVDTSAVDLRTGIKAFHASPYDFEKFDSSKIGTGQGAQSFGHGHYSAQMEPTAETYLSVATPEVRVAGKPLPMPTWNPKLSPEHWLIRRIGDARMVNRTAPEAEILAKVKDDLAYEAKNKWASDAGIASAKEQQRLLAEWEQQGLASKHGHMYEIAINADPEHLLDWDKPLSEQSEHVQAAVNKIRNRRRDEFGLTWKETPIQKLDLGDYATERWGPQFRSEVVDPKTKKAIAVFQGGSPEEVTAKIARWNTAREEAFLNQTGEEFYKARADAADVKSRGSMTYAARKQAASTQLREAGVPGIKYLDQGSRQAGQGTYNYVITDDKLIDILRKFGMLLPAVGAANYGALAKQIVPPGEEAK